MRIRPEVKWNYVDEEQLMELMTPEIAARFKEVGSQEKLGDKAIVIAKFFDPAGSWTWYATEYDPKANTCFGLVQGFELEYGDFSLTELQEVRGSLGTSIERDIHWKERPVGEVHSLRETGRRV